MPQKLRHNTLIIAGRWNRTKLLKIIVKQLKHEAYSIPKVLGAATSQYMKAIYLEQGKVISITITYIQIHIPITGSKHHANDAAALKQEWSTAQLNTTSSQIPVRCKLENLQDVNWHRDGPFISLAIFVEGLL